MRASIFCTLLVFMLPLYGDYVAQPLDDTTSEPYRYTGWIETADWQGSGSVVTNARAAITAGHIVYDHDRNRWIDEVEWKERNEGSRIKVRTFRYFAAYADLLGENHSAAPRVFSEDFAVIASYEQLITSGGVASFVANPRLALIGTAEKMAVGFPSGLYADSDPRGEKMHRTGPLESRFFLDFGDYWGADGISTGPGASGGGLWVREDARWKYAATIVSGLSFSLGDPRNAIGVVAFSAAKEALYQDALQLIGQFRTPMITSHPSEVVGNYHDALPMTVEFTGFPLPSATLYYRTESGSGVLSTEVGIEGQSVTFEIPAQSGGYHEGEFRIELSNTIGTASTPWFSFRYIDVFPPAVGPAPEVVTLDRGEEKRITIPVSGFPEPTVHWVTERASGEAVYLSSYGDHPYTIDGNSITLKADRRELEEARIRLEAASQFGVATSDWMVVNLEDPVLSHAEYGALPSMPLGIEDLAHFNVDVDFPAQVTWWVRGPFSDEWTQIGSGWGHDLEISQVPFESNWHGTSLRAEVRWPFYSLRYGEKEVTKLLDPILISGDGIPILGPTTLDLAKRTGSLDFAALRTPNVEWQILDPEGDEWIPLRKPFGTVVTTGSRSTFRLVSSPRDLQLRAVVFDADRPFPPGIKGPWTIEAGYTLTPSQVEVLRLDGVSSIAVSEQFVMARESSDTGLQLLTWQWRDGIPQPASEPLPVPAAVAGSIAYTFSDDRLMVYSLGARPAEESGSVSVWTYLWDHLRGAWEFSEQLRLPVLGDEELLVARVGFLGDWINVTLRDAPNRIQRHHLFRQSGEEWVPLLRFAPPEGVSEADWFAFHRKVFLVGDALFVTGPDMALRQKVAVYRHDPVEGTIVFQSLHPAPFEIRAIVGRMFFGYETGMTNRVKRARWDPAEGFTPLPDHQWVDSTYNLRIVNASRFDSHPESVFLLGHGNRISAYRGEGVWGPFMKIEISEEVDFIQRVFINITVGPDHFFGLSERKDGAFSLGVVPLHLLRMDAGDLLAPTLVPRCKPETGIVEWIFRKPIAGDSRWQLESSSSFQSWEAVTEATRVVHRDLYGDGTTEERALEVRSTDGPIFLRFAASDELNP